MVWQGRFDRLFIDGEWVKPSGTDQISVVSPSSEQILARVPAGGRADVDRAVAAARKAFDAGPWPRMTLDERIGILLRFRDAYRSRQEEMAELITAEMGSPISQSRAIQVTAPLAILENYVDVAREYPFTSVRRSITGTSVVSQDPVGVVAAIVPWNVPQTVTMQKLAPALLAGCTVILKPAPETPLDAFLLTELLQEAGLPDGVLNVVPADREVSEYLVTRQGVDKVTFTGSTAAGRRIASLCGHDLKRVTLELGGKSAAIILDDADVDTAVESLRFGALRNSGQVCSLKTRLVVSRRRQREVLEKLSSLVASMPLGDPMDPSTQFGPVVSARQRERIEGYISSGKKEGATVVFGGGRPAGLDHGWYVQPTIFTGVTPDMTIAREEIFGPVLSVLSYEDEAEAIVIANDSVYGLNGAVFTSDLAHGLDVARRIRTGTVELNGNPVGFRSPIGGVKDSGIGREQGPEGLSAYLELRSIGVPGSFADSLL